LKAILIINQIYPEAARVSTNTERSLPPLVDRPFLQHAIETLVEAGAEEIDIVLPGSSKFLDGAFGSGSRWGIDIRYVATPDSANPYDALTSIEMPPGDSAVLLAHADTLPQIKEEGALQCSTPTFFCWRDGGVVRWTGWAVLRSGDVGKICIGSNSKDVFHEYCVHANVPERGYNSVIEEVPRPLMVTSYSQLLDAHLRVLRNQHSGLHLTGREIGRGVRISRNVTIHRTAKVIGPVYIGENCRISEHCHIGPGASIGHDCLIESRTAIEDSIVCPGSYVGEGLDLRQAYVDGRRLVNSRLKTEIESVDELLLGRVYRSKRGFGIKTAVSWIK
jgi:mannose-1-phosphate guanylyltransferase/phosphomannomutase